MSYFLHFQVHSSTSSYTLNIKFHSHVTYSIFFKDNTTEIIRIISDNKKDDNGK